jgi:mRNA interferase YafQ
MYHLVVTTSFKKDVKRLQKRKIELDLLKQAIRTLESEGQLPSNYKPHKLLGNYSGYWEAHLKSDWLIIWKIKVNKKSGLPEQERTPIFSPDPTCKIPEPYRFDERRRDRY